MVCIMARIPLMWSVGMDAVILLHFQYMISSRSPAGCTSRHPCTRHLRRTISWYVLSCPVYTTTIRRRFRRHIIIVILTVMKCFIRLEEHTSELQSRENLVCRLLLEKKKVLKTNMY